MNVAELFLAACGLFGSGCDLPLPEIRMVPEGVMLEKYCEDKCDEDTGLWGLYDTRDPDVILINETMTGRDLNITIVHELIHYLQHKTRDPWRWYREIDEHYKSLDPASAYAVRLWQLREVAKHTISTETECEAYRLAERWNQRTGGVPKPIPYADCS